MAFSDTRGRYASLTFGDGVFYYKYKKLRKLNKLYNSVFF